jgi:NADH:ubiquinone oxidoreductase subunit 3 (subunit A)
MKYLSNIALIILFIISSITLLLIHPWTLSSDKYGTMTDWIGAEFSIFSFIA